MKGDPIKRQAPWLTARDQKLVGYQGTKIVAEVYADPASSSWRCATFPPSRAGAPLFRTPDLARHFVEKVLHHRIKWLLARVESPANR